VRLRRIRWLYAEVAVEGDTRKRSLVSTPMRAVAAARELSAERMSGRRRSSSAGLPILTSGAGPGWEPGQARFQPSGLLSGEDAQR